MPVTDDDVQDAVRARKRVRRALIRIGLQLERDRVKAEHTMRLRDEAIIAASRVLTVAEIASIDGLPNETHIRRLLKGNR